MSRSSIGRRRGGLASTRARIRSGDPGLWNQQHLDENYAPDFLDVLEAAVERNAAHHPCWTFPEIPEVQRS
jgi:hypothetical protein